MTRRSVTNTAAILASACAELAVPPSTSAETVNGTIDFSGLDLHLLEASEELVRGLLGTGEGSITVETINGDIELGCF
jgi:hypothetical protein